jgi:hypothetical protein
VADKIKCSTVDIKLLTAMQSMKHRAIIARCGVKVIEIYQNYGRLDGGIVVMGKRNKSQKIKKRHGLTAPLY